MYGYHHRDIKTKVGGGNLQTELAKKVELESPIQTRRNMVGALKKAQLLEHKFYDECKEAVRKASSQLADHFSDLIQRQIPKWDQFECDEFATHSGIAPERLTVWRSSFETLLIARAEVITASAKLKSAELSKSASGGLFGAKKGLEDQYEAAASQHKSASEISNSAKQNQAQATKAATEAAEVLLRECVRCAAVLAKATSYAPSKIPREILVEAAASADMLAKEHNQQQSLIHSELHRDLNTLSQHY